MFSPLRRHPSIVDACVETLRATLLEAERGTRLPPERRLAQQLGVSRGTLRAALGRLESQGLLRVVQGSGYTVDDYRQNGGLDLLPGLLEGLGAGQDRWEIARDLLSIRRRLAEEVLLRLAAMEGDIETGEIEVAVGAFVEAIERGDSRELADLDRRVLRAVVAATGSTVLQLCLNPIGQVLERYDDLREAIYRDAASSTAAYGLLVAWLRDPQRAEPDLLLRALEARDELTLQRLSEGEASL